MEISSKLSPANLNLRNAGPFSFSTLGTMFATPTFQQASNSPQPKGRILMSRLPIDRRSAPFVHVVHQYRPPRRLGHPQPAKPANPSRIDRSTTLVRPLFRPLTSPQPTLRHGKSRQPKDWPSPGTAFSAGHPQPPFPRRAPTTTARRTTTTTTTNNTNHTSRRLTAANAYPNKTFSLGLPPQPKHLTKQAQLNSSSTFHLIRFGRGT